VLLDIHAASPLVFFWGKLHNRWQLMVLNGYDMPGCWLNVDPPTAAH
jgi:hypothetical protein